jgi:hypothetical protein
MNNCFNCLNFGNPRCIPRKDCEKWKPDYPTLESENAELKRELEAYKRVLESVFLDVESIFNCPINYPAFEEFMGDCNCEGCKERHHYSECWMKVYLAQARKELAK